MDVWEGEQNDDVGKNGRKAVNGVKSKREDG